MKILAQIFTAIIITSCATADFNYSPTSTEISEPPLNTLNTSYIGDPLLHQGKYTEHPAIYVSTLIEIGSYDISPGYYVKKGEDKNTETFLPANIESGGGSITKSFIGDPWKGLLVHKGENKVCIATTYNTVNCKNTSTFQRKTLPVMSLDSFQQTLMYNGKVGSKLSIGYREQSGNLARPAFNNSVEYDLENSNIIGYKGARIEIIEATNEYVKYKVLKNFNKAKY